MNNATAIDNIQKKYISNTEVNESDINWIISYFESRIKHRLELMQPEYVNSLLEDLLSIKKMQTRGIPEYDNACSDIELAKKLFSSQKQINEQAESFEKYLANYKPDSKSSFLYEEGGTLNADELAKELGKSVQTISRLYKERKLVGVQKRTGKTSPRLFPKWQFNNGKVIDGVLELIQILDDNSAQCIEFVLTEKIELENKRPLDYLRSGDMTRVFAIAELFKNSSCTSEK